MSETADQNGWQAGFPALGYASFGISEDFFGTYTKALAPAPDFAVLDNIPFGLTTPKRFEVDFGAGTMTLNTGGPAQAILVGGLSASVLSTINNEEIRLRLRRNGAYVPLYAELDSHTSQRRGGTILGANVFDDGDVFDVAIENLETNAHTVTVITMGFWMQILDWVPGP